MRASSWKWKTEYDLTLQNVVCRLSLWNYIIGSGLKCLLDGIKCTRIDQWFMSSFDNPFFLSLHQHTSVGAIGKNVLYRATVPIPIAIVKVSTQAIGSGILNRGRKAPFIQISDNTSHANATCGHLKNFPNNNSRCRIRDNLARILAGLLITKWGSRPDKFSTLCFHV
ncbi:hypothetical protein IMSAGC019_01883 [Lachnospiraceae bacterium]|nr:hypothetical protein IMSAGC019_01883 [Lachnospiraceae bacterium]